MDQHGMVVPPEPTKINTIFLRVHARAVSDGDKWLLRNKAPVSGLNSIRQYTSVEYLMERWAQTGGWD